MGKMQQIHRDSAAALGGQVTRAYFAVFYISMVWLTYCFTVPIDVFQGVPLYVVLTPLMFFVMPEALLPAIILSLALLGYECLKFVQPGFEPTTKGFLGIAVLAPILAICYYSLASLRILSDRFIGGWLRALLYIFLGAILIDQVLGFAGITTNVYPHYFLPIERRSGLVSEPSFVALWLSPYLFMIGHNFAMFKRYLGLSSLCMVLAIMILCPSATLIAILALTMTILATEYLLRGSAFGLFASLLTLSVVLGVIIALPDVADRVNGVIGADAGAKDQNMSSLVFVKGRQMASYALLNMPLGVSFQDMASLTQYSDVAYLNKTIWSLNSDDGSSILFKGICELGILFLLVACVALWRFLKNILSDARGSMFTLVVLSFQFSAFAHFLRASSYFDGVIVIGLAVCVFDSFTSTLVDLRHRRRRMLRFAGPRGA